MKKAFFALGAIVSLVFAANTAFAQDGARATKEFLMLSKSVYQVKDKHVLYKEDLPANSGIKHVMTDGEGVTIALELTMNPPMQVYLLKGKFNIIAVRSGAIKIHWDKLSNEWIVDFKRNCRPYVEWKVRSFWLQYS